LCVFKTASDIVNNVMKKLVELCVEGAKVLDICVKGDELLEQGTSGVYNKLVKGVKVTKGTQMTAYRVDVRTEGLHVGIAFPTCVSVNNCVAHFSPLACAIHLLILGTTHLTLFLAALTLHRRKFSRRTT
jgi:methionine aminopeptidase